MNLSVLYISYDGLTDPLGQSQILPYLEGLSEFGVNFHLITFEKKEQFKSLKRVVEKRCIEANINWHPINYTKNPPLFSTLYDLRKMQKKALNLQASIGFDIVHCRSYLPAVVGHKLKLNHDVKFVFDMRGFWADERVEGKIWSLSNPIFKLVYRFFKRKERLFFKDADATISLTENGRNEILSWEEISKVSPFIEVIPCCVDLEKFNPNKISSSEIKEVKAQLDILKEEFVLGYIGSIGTWYMLDEMLDYYAVLRTKQKSSKFLFISGESPENIVSKARSKGIPKEEVIVKKVKHDQVPLYSSIFDCSIFFIRPTFSKKASSPTKQGELMAMGVPIICNSGVGDTDEIVLKYNAGEIVESFNYKTYNKISLDFSKYDKGKIIDGAHEVYSLKKGVQRYFDVYKQVFGKTIQKQ
ncbi:MAG: glycosyltransferase [Brumimicrobium sp.]